ncbi:MAG: hypothetical protein KOO60_07105 [Gemmatimonadales bacterium]|nr:hypothetical protein [Gemmatimonadales bacterium]
MPRNPRVILMVALLLLGGTLIGCSDEAVDPLAADPLADNSPSVDNYDLMDFSLPYGGLTTSDEAEAFGDGSLQLMMLAEDEELVDDPLADDPAISERPVFTFLKLRWGMLSGPEDSLRVNDGHCEVTDWTGELHTDRGLVVVRRMVAFEQPADHVIFPRLDEKTVAFVSHTSCGSDGLVIQIIERPIDPDAEGYIPNILHINLAGYQGEFEVGQLAALDLLIEVDEQGNQIQLTGFKISDLNICPKGFLSGRFGRIPGQGDAEEMGVDERPGEHLGNIAGTWTNLTGRIEGFLRGGYGLDQTGNRVFFGKYIDRQGRFRGMLVGTWELAAEERDLAAFSGHWVSASGNAEGRLGGRAYSVEGSSGGFFAGRWATLCDDEAVGEIR